MLLSLMTRSTYGDTLRLYNNECFGLAEDALKNVNWKQHSDNLWRARILWFTLSALIAAALAFGIVTFLNYLTKS
jgi:hypothetical protein